MNELSLNRNQMHPLELDRQNIDLSLLEPATLPVKAFAIVTSRCDTSTTMCFDTFLPGDSDQLLALQEAERQRIAIELHDGVGQLLTLIKLELKNAAAMLVNECLHEALARTAIERADRSLCLAFSELRRTVMDLRPSMLDDLGILPTLRWLLREIEGSGAGLELMRSLTVEEGDIPPALKIVIFRVCQEALNNVIKHARARRIMLVLARLGEQLHLSIEDDGCGFCLATADIRNRAGGGLAGIVRRANSSGGKCIIDSQPQYGTCIAIVWSLVPQIASAVQDPALDNHTGSLVATSAAIAHSNC